MTALFWRFEANGWTSGAGSRAWGVGYGVWRGGTVMRRPPPERRPRT
ncbi:MAG: hypothetical protein U0Q12_02010 [Vicinamibacterales bacterium]